jgi:nitrite reductase/ring-hydroxylating ferredoxin subunit
MWVRATELAVLQRNGGVKRVQHPRRDLAALVILEDDEIVAVIDECPHQGSSLIAGYRRNGWIECPLHAWRFDLRTGHGISHPTECLATYPTRVVDGTVEVDLPD